MDNERFTLDKRKRKIALIGGGHSKAMTVLLNLGLEASVLLVDDGDEIRGLDMDGLIIDDILPFKLHNYKQDRMPYFEKFQRQNDFDHKGRRRRR
jgi:hypothetical protein